MNPKKFGPNLNKVLEFMGMSQTELANRAGLQPSEISHLINNRRSPSLKNICKILKVIPVKFEKLIED